MTPFLAALVLLAELSPAVYPPDRSPFPGFDHPRHVALGLDCATCHRGVRTSTRAEERHLPSPADCQSCHPAGFEAGIRAGAPVVPPAPALVFSHRAHHDRGIPCARCHGDAATGRPSLPSMDLCTTCHDGRAADGRCGVCHPAGVDRRLITDLPTGKLVPRGRFRAADHADPAFARRHGPTAAADPAYCATCHAPDQCRACHDGDVRPVNIHPADYILTHSVPARRNDPDCTSCHRLQSFCVRCHTLGGVTAAPGRLSFGADAAGRTDFHPPGWTDLLGGVPGPGHHRVAARRNLRECVSCHQEPDCVVCHAVDTTARLRASPHGPDPRDLCGRPLDANPRGCLKCHRDREALDRLCR